MSQFLNYTLSISFFLFVLAISGQTIITGKVVDSENNIALSEVSISTTDENSIVTSGINGDIELNKPGVYTFKRVGYKEKTIELKDDQFQIVQMEVSPTELDEVMINANQLPKKLKQSTATVSLVTSRDIKRQDNNNIAPILNRVPGVFMQSAALNTNRITIRGVGSRNLYGTAKIRAYYKDIPLTTGNGETTIEDFELGAISNLEIVKGSSSIYGAGLGGTIQLNPQNSYLNTTNISGELTVGSFDLLKAIVNANHGNQNNSYRAVYSNTSSAGYRENNEYNRQTFTLGTNHFIGEKDALTFLVSYVDLKAYIPSSLNEEDYINSPTSAAFTWKASKGYEDSKRGVFGLSWKHQYTENLEQVTSVFTSFRDAYEPRPFNILEENTNAFGLRTRLIGKTKFLNKKLNWSTGIEGFRDNYTSKTFQNLYKEYPPNHGSVQGELLSDFEQYRNYVNVFFETNYNISEKTIFSFGLNYNKTTYELEDNYPVSDQNPDQSGTFKYDGIFSPKFGLNYELSKNISLYSNVSHGFSPLTLEETLLPNGQINTNLKPETGWNFELGTRGSAIGNRLNYNASIFRLAINNYLVARRISDDQYYGINAGSTQHDGLELDLNYQFVNTDKFNLSSFVSYTLNNFIFKEFIDDEHDYSGNDLTGVPSEVFNIGLDFWNKIGLYGNLNFQHVGSMPMTDSNSLYSESYNLTNFKVGYKTTILKKLELNFFYGLNNIFDEKYASQILINASGFGGRAPRYYYPGNPRNFYAGINLNYIF